MKKGLKGISETVLAFCAAALTGVTALGAGSTGDGEIRIIYECDNKAVPAANIEVFYVASWDLKGGFAYNTDWSECGVSLDNIDDKTAGDLEAYALSMELSGALATTGNDGRSVFDGLGEGLYLITQTGWDIDNADYECFSPFIVSIPYLTDGTYVTSVEARPKTELLPEESTSEIETTPEESSSETETTPQESSSETETTPEESSSYEESSGDFESSSYETSSEYESESESDSSPEETTTRPDGGNVGDDDSGHLPITGMVVWPITVLSLAGMVFLILGYADNKRRERRYRK